ncbi:hypothetical protein SAMD00023353_5100950 [Rosellinia necatrix]|uniref:Uncharacterized protein n=1 Tax=Rosellinia necatrix TaxID=77044 RepID=A0A1W2TR61_ROSNE|nr:hypothetical protein SAMD00023353_5100950 [Rosellinia necatrix]
MGVQTQEIRLADAKAAEVPRAPETTAGPMAVVVAAAAVVPAKPPSKKALPFNPAKLRAPAPAPATATPSTARPRPAATKGAKPTGITKKTKRPPTTTTTASKKKATTTTARRGRTALDKALADARRWLTAPTAWTMRNAATGCVGSARRHPIVNVNTTITNSEEGGGGGGGGGATTTATTTLGRAVLTVSHGAGCGCAEARLLHVCARADALVRARRLARSSRDAFVLAAKLRRDLGLGPGDIPAELAFPEDERERGHGSEWDGEEGEKEKEEEEEEEARRRLRREAEAETRAVPVVDVYRQQRLVERWKSLEAYRARRIWLDW